MLCCGGVYVVCAYYLPPNNRAHIYLHSLFPPPPPFYFNYTSVNTGHHRWYLNCILTEFCRTTVVSFFVVSRASRSSRNTIWHATLFAIHVRIMACTSARKVSWECSVFVRSGGNGKSDSSAVLAAWKDCWAALRRSAVWRKIIG